MLQPGDLLLGKYRIEALVGQGAFAEVYRVTHLALRVPRALKILRRDAPGIGSTEFGDYRGRFELEAQLGARLNSPTPHPHLIQVHDFHAEGELLVLEMEYAPGGSLADRLAHGREAGQLMPVDEAVRIALDVAQGLAALHAVDAVHRDLKPSNILFDGRGRAKVADLGLAQAPGGASQRDLLGSLARPHPGTPGYKSPEQERSTDHLTPASDVYALGAVLFEMLTGRLYRSQRPGTRLLRLCPAAPAWLDELAARMLADDPAARPWDGDEVAAALAAGPAEAEVRAKAEAEENAKAEAERQRPALEAEQARLREEEVRRQAEVKAQAEMKLAAERARQAEEARLAETRQEAEARVRREAAAEAPAVRKWPGRWILLASLLVAVIIWLVAVLGRTPGLPGPTPLPVRTKALELTQAPEFTQAPAAAAPTKAPAPTGAPGPTQEVAGTQTVEDAALSLTLARGVTLDLVRVPAGEFLMGSDKAQDPLAIDDELPQHPVTLPEYWIGKHEVTNRQFEAFVKATGHSTPEHWPGGRIPAGKEDHPVVLVSWDDAVAFSQWASAVTGRALRLPSEAEWEKAARGTDGRIYPWGNAAPDAQRCNFNWQAGGTTPVGQYPAGVSPYGTLDMAGNVWEWTSSLYKPYPYQGGDGREDPNERGARVLRGGSFLGDARGMRCACRNGSYPGSRSDYFGFRVASPGLGTAPLAPSGGAPDPPSGGEDF